jgi:hypothetical protein
MREIDRIIEGRDPQRSIGFSASPVLPGEEQKEFQCLLDELCGQYEPEGPAEQDVIRTMASAIFRKRHLEDVAEIVKNNTKIEFESAIDQLHRNGASSRREYEARKSDVVHELISTFEAAFGPGTVKEMLEPLCREDIEQKLPRFGDLLTPERYAAEFQFNELLDITIERSHDRLMKYQAARTKKLSGNISSLQPDWAHKR